MNSREPSQEELAIMKESQGIMDNRSLEQRKEMDSSGCSFAKPGQGDCEHFVGLPMSSDCPIPGRSDGPVNVYSKPDGWCWSCWKSYQIDKLRGEVRALEAWQNVAAESNRDVSAYLQKEFPFLELDGGMPIDNIRRVVKYLIDFRGKLSASEALFGFMGWLTTRDEAVTFSGHHNAGKAADLVGLFCEVNDLADPRGHWEKNLVHPKEHCKPIAMGEVTEEGRSLSSWRSDLDQILSKLSGDLSQDNVSAAKQMLKKML